MKKIFTLVSVVDNCPEPVKSYSDLNYETAIDIRRRIIKSEAPSDDQDDLDTVDECFLEKLWEEIDDWIFNSSERGNWYTVIWSDGCVDYVLLESELD